MKKNLSLLIMGMVILPMMVVCQPHGIHMTAHSDKQPDTPLSQRGVLYEQLGNPSGTGIVSQDFPDYPTYCSQGADDFLVPDGETWLIEEIIVPGFYHQGVGLVMEAHVFIYQDDPAINLPGGILFEFLNQPVSSTPEGVLMINLTSAITTTPLMLNSGHYWISVQAHMEFTGNGQWMWLKQLAPTIVNEMAWRNPGGGFGVPGGENWQSGSVAWPGSADHNLSFGLYGTNQGGAQAPSNLYLRPGIKTNPEPWYAWIGGIDQVSPVQLFVDDPEEQIAIVNFYVSHNPAQKEWMLFYTDYDGFSFSAPGPSSGIHEEADGWCGYLWHEMLVQDETQLFFMAEVITHQGEMLEVISEIPLTYDPYPPSDYELSIEDEYYTDQDFVTISITSFNPKLDYVVFNVSEKDSVYQKSIPFVEQQDDMACGPYALAACLKYFADSAGYTGIDGNLDIVALAEALKSYVKYDSVKGAKDIDLASGVREWIAENGGGFTVTGPQPFSKFNTTDMRNKLEGDGLLNGISQNIIPLFQWFETDSTGKVDTLGHFMTMSSVHNTVVEGKRRFDFMDPGDNFGEEYVEGDIDVETGECSGFDGNYPPNGAKVFSTIMICPIEPAPNPNGGGTTSQGPEFPPVEVTMPESGKTVVRTRSVNQSGHKAEKDIVITRVKPAEYPPINELLPLGGSPFKLEAGIPEGGSYNGPNVTDGWFYPIEEGDFIITYAVTYPSGFVSSCTFVITVSAMDFGDAPEPYPTLFADNGARHIIDPGVYLGELIDAEPDGQPTVNADGDDLNNLDDEDGIIFLTSLSPGATCKIEITASVDGFLSGWIDFDINGSWADATDQIFAEIPIQSGVNELSFVVPPNAQPGNSYARFRFSTNQSGLSYVGLAQNGEVEDYLVEIIESETIKWIQNPLLPAMGYHAHDVMFTQYYIADDWLCEGGLVTDLHWWGYTEYNYPSPKGFRISIYDNDNTDTFDKPGTLLHTWDALMGDGIGQVQHFNTGYQNNPYGQPIYYTFDLPQPFAQIEGNKYWFELMALSEDPFNDNTIWKWLPSIDPMNLSSAVVRVNIEGVDEPYDEIGGDVAFVVTSEPDSSTEMDFGDAPEPYPTLFADNGARHIINPDVYLGELIDAEPDGQPCPNALGDDLNNLPDEDGVAFMGPLVAGKTTIIKVKASVEGYLNAWLDFNMNGSWADPGDQIFTDQPLAPGINSLSFDIPAGIDPGATFARFRFDTQGNLSYEGIAIDGEVEDYKVIILPEGWGYTPTGSTHIIAVPATLSLNCVSLSAGDFIGVFHTDDDGNLMCGGAIMWDGVNNQALVAFGNDNTTTEKDGFNEGEDFTWKIYKTGSASEEEVMAAYDQTMPDAEGKFYTDGLSALTGLSNMMQITVSADPLSVCEGDEVQLDVIVSGGCGELDYSWTSIPEGFFAVIQNPVDNPTESTTYLRYCFGWLRTG
jgi:hypothetical protein